MAVQPVQKPGLSKQTFGTPEIFIRAVKTYLGISEFDVDLAADLTNYKARCFIDEHADSLKCDWRLWARDGWCWLNPPFADIRPWAKKCAEAGVKVAFLVPAGVGANWFRDYVDGKAKVLMLNGRLAFMPDKPTWLYPKDCVLCLYGQEPGYEVWDWRNGAGRAGN